MVQVVDSTEDLLDGRIPANQPLEWEFLGSDPAAEALRAERHHGRGGVRVGADPASEALFAERHRHGRGVGAYVADVHSLGADPVLATGKILARARDLRPPAPPPARVIPYHEAEAVTLDPVVQEEILGAGGGLDPADFPLATHLYRHFQGKKREPTLVRLDTEESYRGFRADSSPEIAELQQKVAALEALVRAHASDGHGGPIDDVVMGLASDVSQLQATEAEKRLALRMPPWMEGTWDSWREAGPEGGIICSALALPGHDGRPRIATAACPVARHVEDVVRYAGDVGGDVVTLLGVLPTVACLLAGGHLLGELARAAPHLLARPEARSGQPFLGKIIHAPNGPTSAALAVLLQRAQAGDAQARKEWATLAEVALAQNEDLARSMSTTKRRVVAAQSE